MSDIQVVGQIDRTINQPTCHEHKNAEALQPIQFQGSSPISCDEIVILSIEQNRVVGYLAESR